MHRYLVRVLELLGLSPKAAVVHGDDPEEGQSECAIRTNTLAAAEAFRGALRAEPGFDRSSVVWLDEAIRACASEGDRGEPELRLLESMWGTFFGECLVRSFAGKWAIVNDDRFRVLLDRASPERDDLVVFRSIRPESQSSLRTEPYREFRRCGGAKLIPMLPDGDVRRQDGRMIVNPWSAVSDSLRGDEGASVRALYDWIASEPSSAS